MLRRLPMLPRPRSSRPSTPRRSTPTTTRRQERRPATLTSPSPR
uniref:Uncharacterized protein n=1 Tax=Triticum urartu TaxID=4572 RepID=A0A8R7QID2_TRIUA